MIHPRQRDTTMTATDLFRIFERHANLGQGRLFLVIVILSFFFSAPVPAWQDDGAEPVVEPSARIHTAEVRVDGNVLFKVRGVTAFPAEERADLIHDAILAVARDDGFDPNDLAVVEHERYIEFMAGERSMFRMVPADADVEGIPLHVLADVVRSRIIETVTEYRADRTPAALRVSALFLVGLTLAFVLLIWLLRKLRTWVNRLLERHIASSIREIERKSKRLVERQQLWRIADATLGTLYFIVLLALAFLYVDGVLGVFPWTRGAAHWLLAMVMDPLIQLGQGFMRSLPDLFFLVVLFFIVRFVLRFLRIFFRAVQWGRVALPNFDSDWAMPTYKLVRLVVIAFSLVIAYPYIPGSDSAAFKGVSLFLGVMVSLGSTSFISNMIAGLSMTYRGAYREGDWVKIGDEEGLVEEMRMMVMRLRTRKNERVTIPNSVILNANVVNYSDVEGTEGLWLHPEIGIGYDVPWRLVEAMLIEAAGRTEGLKQDPSPFVRQVELGDFTITYEINALVEDPATMPRVTTELYRNIQDVFNENGVQIMSPAYESDPETPKVVPPERWFAEPVKKPD